MKYIILFIFLAFKLFANVIYLPVLNVDKDKQTLEVKLEKEIISGVSGFAIHHISANHNVILNNVVLKNYDKSTNIAVLKLLPFDMLKNDYLPTTKYKIVKGDSIELFFCYDRATLIAPNEEIYHEITKNVDIDWVHPDIFATILSLNGHPTPLKSDFEKMADASYIGLLFLYLDGRLYTLDIKSFKILKIDEVGFKQDKVKLPFYSRVDKIDANWFGEGSDRLESYEPHYYQLLVQNNKHNKKLYNIIKLKNDDKLLTQFEIGK